MVKQHWWILITYILMQLSGFVGIPLLHAIGVTDDPLAIEGFVIWSLTSFSIGLIIVLILSRHSGDYPFRKAEKKPVSESIGWIVIGIVLAFSVQVVAAFIEMKLFNIEPGSKNTEQLIAVTKSFPYFVFVFTVIGPILEEIVFRQIIFGAIYQRFNFLIAVFVSSLIFGIVHGELEHMFIYTSMGAVFAYIYIKTKRIIVPIAAHVAMNTLAAAPAIFPDQLQDFQNNLQQMIGGFS